MGWSFRRSIKMGPLRLNLSTRGVGISAGVRGARVAVGPRGTYVTLGRGGFQYRQRIGGPRPSRSSSEPAQHSAPATPRFPGAEPNEPDGLIQTASVAELAVSSPDAVLQDAQARMRRANLWGWYMG